MAAPLFLAACSDQAGVDGSEILQPFAALSGGMVFATGSSSVPGINGYDLFWVPLPSFSTTDALPLIRLTNADGNEWQPHVAAGGTAIVFVREDDGVHLIGASGRVSRVSSPGDRYRDSLPAVSFDGGRVAWVREDRQAPIGGSGFFETFIMMADYDGQNARAVLPRPHVIQDAPTFEPMQNGVRIAWTEFNVDTLSANGPTDFGVWVHDFSVGTGRYACQSPAVFLGDRPRPYRCFGEHLTWVLNEGFDYLVTGQDLLEINADTGALSTVWPEVVASVQSQGFGTPDIGANAHGFFPRFPLSTSYSRSLDRMLFDGVVYPIDGDSPTLGIFSAAPDGGGVWKLNIGGLVADIDQTNTADYLFSVATPQIIP